MYIRNMHIVLHTHLLTLPKKYIGPGIIRNNTYACSKFMCSCIMCTCMGKEAVTDPDLEINNVMRRGRGAGGGGGGDALCRH